jgi:tetratricopeptide (TPR) repeat protein
MARYISYFAVASFVATLGCATTKKADDQANLYLESAADIKDRAPASMTVFSGSKTSKDKMDHQSSADYHFALAEAYGLEANSARAIEEYKLALLEDDKSPQVRTRLASEYAKLGQVSEAIEQAKEALALSPKHNEALFVLGAVHSSLRLYDEAIKSYQSVLQNDSENLEASMYLGAIYAEQKKFDKAMAQFSSLANNQNNPNAHMAWYYVGRVHSEMSKDKNFSKAQEAYKKALAMKPNYLEAVLSLGQLFETSGRPSDAIKTYHTYQDKHGSNPLVADSLARLHIERSEWTKAYDQLRIIEAAEPEDLNIKMRIAFILIETKQYQESVRRLEEILVLAPGSDKVRYYLGAVFEEVKDYRAAIENFKKIGPESSYFGESVVHVSYLFKLMGDYDKAIATLDDGIKTKGDNPQLYALQASLLDESSNYKRANEVLNVAVQKFPENTQLLFFHGSIQDRIGMKSETEKAMRQILRLDSNHVQAMNYLAYLLAESNRSLEEAETLAKRANELQPNDGYILDTLGWVKFKRGRAPEAIRVLEAAQSMQPNEAIIAEHLGDAYFHQQLPDKAKKMYSRAVENERKAAKSDPENAEKIRQKIAAVDRQVQGLPSIGSDMSDSARRPASQGTKPSRK